jgi:hypothetical protein
MRRLVPLAILVCGLVLPAVALAELGGSGDDATLSVRNGLGKVTLNFTGSVVGRIASGKIVATDPVADDGVGIVTWGCDNSAPKKVEPGTKVCSGDNVRFRAIGGKYTIYVRGTGIFLSLVGRGVATLDGRGDLPAVDYDGTYSLNDQPYKSLPNDEQRIPLVAPAGG